MSLLTKSFKVCGSWFQATRHLHTTLVRQGEDKAVNKWVYNMSGFNKYGLWHDDCLSELNADVAEAVKRLPAKLVDDRHYRMLRATQLSIEKSILPKEEWTKYEEDIHYLEPYIEEVIKERLEREDWNRTH